jgi:hypothetical protein
MSYVKCIKQKYCYIYEVSLDTRQQWTALDSIVTQQCNQAVIEFYSNDTTDFYSSLVLDLV